MKSKKEFVEKHLSTGEFEEKYESDFGNVDEHVKKLFKVGCPRNLVEFLKLFLDIPK